MFYIPIIKMLIGLVVITIQPDWYDGINGNGDKFECGATLRWLYTFYTNQIDICKGTKDKESVLIHELWHYVYFMKLNQPQRDWWEKTVNMDKVWAQELFAEDFQQKIYQNIIFCILENSICVKKQIFMEKVFILLRK